MATDNWIVNNLAGEEWGLIKRLIFDSATRQINYADVVVIQFWATLPVSPGTVLRFVTRGLRWVCLRHRLQLTGIRGTETAVGELYRWTCGRDLTNRVGDFSVRTCTNNQPERGCMPHGEDWTNTTLCGATQGQTGTE